MSTHDGALHWAQAAAEEFVPRHVLDDAMIRDLELSLPICNMVRAARGEPTQTIAEAIEERRAEIASGVYAERLPQLIGKARALSEAAQRQLACNNIPPTTNGAGDYSAR
ncbi:hypothetical protein [Lentzea flava]|uniref:Uncharacterized protein n=1 Tax=Lentzea flava TaxID=103732 RepID=A0ABQ2V1K3_9PSEU|nr:hypothetical protein [Lentzea flava]MCP2202716.1 hypothetical protein [Lentzea flava]GGU61705.1 hypothetical protein GCM10010178_62350 [Lentzea flava]